MAALDPRSSILDSPSSRKEICKHSGRGARLPSKAGKLSQNWQAVLS